MKDSKYEEALERARQGMPIDEVFPELKESEDERIRKDLITFICQFAPEHLKVKYVAYLEKQKDERELVFIEGKMEGVSQTCQEIKDAMSLFEPKDLTPFESTFRDYVDSAIRYCLAGEGYQQYIKEWAADLLNLEKQKEQKPAEWSEEDELMRTVVIQTLERFGGRGTTGMQIDWLKSLRPQPRWKPSEEQMEWLESAVKLSTDKPHIHGIIISLYEQLKRL